MKLQSVHTILTMERQTIVLSGHINRVKFLTIRPIARINGVVTLTVFSYKKIYGRFAGTKKGP